MRLTRYSDYALRSLLFLALHPKDKLANISDIAKAYNISKSHLTKIIHQLALLGYVQSVRGKNGGIRINKDPKEINIGTLVRHTEAGFEIVECFESNNATIKPDTLQSIPMVNVLEQQPTKCVISPVCELKWVMAEATQAFVAVLDGYTLADMMTNSDKLRQYLQINR